MDFSDPCNMFLFENSFLKLKREWVHETNEERSTYGEFHHLYYELRKHPNDFCNYTKMTIETFDHILENIYTRILKQDTTFRKCIKPEEMLFITLRYLSTGMSFRALAHTFRVGKTTIGGIIYNTCHAIWDILQPIHMPKPTKELLIKVASDYYIKWKFPNCCGSIDGKHCRIKNPEDTGSSVNHKKYFSIILQAVADAHTRFLVIEVEESEVEGSKFQSDGATFQSSELYQSLESGDFMPDDKTLPNFNCVLPNVLIGDGAYPLKKYLMRPYPKKNLSPEKSIFNDRLSMARKSIESAFSLTSMQWRILTKSMECSVSNANLIIRTCCLLHNIVIDKDNLHNVADDNTIVTSTFQEQKLTTRLNNRSSSFAMRIREKFTKYFVLNPL